jgi:glycosyltransferase involved in cell wall biosynthesis
MSVTVVMPAWRESEIIEAAVREWHDEVTSKIEGAKLIVVDDCSPDDTGAILMRLAEELPELEPALQKVNRGHGPSVRIGLDLAQTEWVFQTDSDRQFVPSEFWNLWNVRDDQDFVLGRRSTREDGWFRVFITNGVRIANLLLWGVWVRDANCPFKLMRREPMQEVLRRIPKDAFIPMIHFSILARKMGKRVRVVSVTHLPRTGGTQSLSGMARWVGVVRNCLKEIVHVRFHWRSAA